MNVACIITEAILAVTAFSTETTLNHKMARLKLKNNDTTFYFRVHTGAANHAVNIKKHLCTNNHAKA